MSKIVKRTLDFFELFAEHKRPLSLSEISKLLGIPVSSCHDVLRALEDENRRLKHLLAEAELDKAILKTALGKK